MNVMEKKINLNTLKAITNHYNKNYPSSFDYDFIIKTSKENIRKKFIELLCKNFDKLSLLINKKDASITTSPIKKDDYFKPAISDNLKSAEIKIIIKPADKEYLKKLKKN